MPKRHIGTGGVFVEELRSQIS